MNDIITNMFEEIEDLDMAETIIQKEKELIQRDDTKIIDIYDLIPHERNRELDQIYVEDLAKNIRLNGLLQYPIVTPDGNGKFVILAGHNRIAACKYNVENYDEEIYKKIRCIVKSSDDIDNELILIDTNVKINPLSPYDLMNALGRKEELLRLKKQKGEIKGNLKSIISEESTLARSQVQTYLTIYKKAVPAVKKALKSSTINLSQAFKISKLPIERQDEELIQIQMKKSKKNKDVNERYQRLLKSYFNASSSLNDYLQTLPESMLDDRQHDLMLLITQMHGLIKVIIDEGKVQS